MLKIINDTSCDFTDEIVKEYGFVQIPNGVVIDGKHYNEYWEIKSDEFFKKQAEAKTTPTTTMIDLGILEQEFRKIVDNGDEGLYISISSKMSGGYNAAKTVLEQLEEEYGRKLGITIFDSYTITFQLGLMVMEAKKMADNGATIDEIIEKIVKVRDNIHTLYVIENLDYLAKGGRLNPAVAAMGNLLNIKPVIEIKNGMIDQRFKEMGRKKAVNKILKTMEAEIKDTENLQLTFIHGNTLENYESFKESVLAKFHPTQIYETRAGCAVGAHTGPLVFGVFYTVNGY